MSDPATPTEVSPSLITLPTPPEGSRSASTRTLHSGGRHRTGPEECHPRHGFQFVSLELDRIGDAREALPIWAGVGGR
jgi:hypothetical protein